MSKYFLILFIWAVVLSPIMVLIPRIPAFKIEDIILVVLFIDTLLQFRRKAHDQSIIDDFNRPFLIIGFIAIFSIVLQEVLYNRTIVLNDLMILPMIVKYVLIYEVVKINTQHYGIKPFLNALLASIVVSAVIGIMQYHNVLGINTWLTPRYKIKELDVQGLLAHTIWARTIGTVGNPQKFGQLLLFGTAICFSNIFQKKNVYVLCVLLFFLIWAIIYTLSRITIITLLITFIVSLFLSQYKDLSFLKLAKYLLLICAITVVLFKYIAVTKGFKERVLRTQTESYQHSSHARIRDFKKPFSEINSNPTYLFFGKGPSKEYIKTSMHNDFSWMLERYGIFAYFAYIFIVLRSIKKGMDHFKKTDNPADKILSICIINVFLTWFCFALAEDVFKEPKVMPFNMFFLASLATMLSSDGDAEKGAQTLEKSENP